MQKMLRHGLSMACLLGVPAIASAAPLVAGNWNSTFTANFDVGSSDLAGWNYDTGGGGWGNNELQTYTSNAANASVSGGALHITAVASGSGANKTYTSARLKTDTLFTQTNGLFEFRAKMPTGQGLWPAIWMMPKNSSYGVWPTSGEIDVLETTGQSPTLVQGSLHTGASWDTQYTQTQTFAGSGLMPSGFSTTDWHTYDLEWIAGTGGKAGTIKWYVDGTLYETQTNWAKPAGVASADAPFDKPFYLILNMAVGGDYVGTPNLANGSYDMQVDYARAYSLTTPEPASLAIIGVASMAMLRRRRKSGSGPLSRVLTGEG